MLDDFADCVAGKPSIGASGREALVPVRVVDAAYRSVKTGKPVTVYTETEDT
jgi:predicted dehydrogenase